VNGRHGGACLAVIAWLTGAAHAERQPSLATVLDRAGAYVDSFERQLSGIVAEEHYVQEVLTFTKRRGCPSNATYASVLNCQGQLVNPIRAELRSDLGLVRPVGAATWTEFRDVFESNGAPVRDRTERLTKLFAGDEAGHRDQIGHILAESSRFNIGDISRNINTPLFPLQFLEPRNQPRFAFKRAGKAAPATFTRTETPTAAFRVSVDVWIVEYEEKQAGTMIRTQGMRDLPARGRFWIEPDTGRVLMSELVARNHDLHATIDVSYQSEPLLGCLVPIEMREEYQDRRGSHITGAASYGRFRQFQVNVDEKFLPTVKR
jgi:hypothetical protein